MKDLLVFIGGLVVGVILMAVCNEDEMDDNDCDDGFIEDMDF